MTNECEQCGAPEYRQHRPDCPRVAGEVLPSLKAKLAAVERVISRLSEDPAIRRAAGLPPITREQILHWLRSAIAGQVGEGEKGTDHG